METIRDFIDRRRAEIKAQISLLKSELYELSLAESALRLGVVTNSSPLRKDTKRTIKEMVVDVLTGTTNGSDANEIIELIQRKFGETLVRSSLSPQLSRLKEDGVLTLSGKLWSLNKSSGDTESEKSESPEFRGGNEERGQAFPAGPPEGATPSTSSSIHHSGLSRDLDDEIPF